MRGPSFPKVNLDGIMLPEIIILLHGNKIYGKSAHRAFFRQCLCDLSTFHRKGNTVYFICEENCTQKYLSIITTQQLVMCTYNINMLVGVNYTLHRGRHFYFGFQEYFHDSSHGTEFFEE